MTLYGGTVLLVGSWFVFEVMFVDCSVDGKFRSVSLSRSYLWLNLKISETAWFIICLRIFPRSKLLRFGVSLSSPSMLNSLQPCALLRYRSVPVHPTNSFSKHCFVGKPSNVLIKVTKLDGRYIDRSFCRINENELSLIAIILLFFQLADKSVLLGIIQVSAGECYWSDFVILLYLT